MLAGIQEIVGLRPVEAPRWLHGDEGCPLRLGHTRGPSRCLKQICRENSRDRHWARPRVGICLTAVCASGQQA